VFRVPILRAGASLQLVPHCKLEIISEVYPSLRKRYELKARTSGGELPKKKYKNRNENF